MKKTQILCKEDRIIDATKMGLVWIILEAEQKSTIDKRKVGCLND